MANLQGLYKDLESYVKQLDSISSRISEEGKRELESYIEELKYKIAYEENKNKRGKYRSKEVKESLLEAVKRGNIEVVNMLLELGADVKSNQVEYLNIAIKTEQLDILNLLISYGADVNSSNFLEKAVLNRNKELVKILLDAKANPNLDSKKLRPGYYTYKGSMISFIVSLALTATFILLTIFVSCHYGWGIIPASLLVCFIGGEYDPFHKISEIKKSIRFPLDAAIPNVELVTMLIEYGADVRNNKVSALWRAAKENNSEVVRVLKNELSRIEKER